MPEEWGIDTIPEMLDVTNDRIAEILASYGFEMTAVDAGADPPLPDSETLPLIYHPVTDIACGVCRPASLVSARRFAAHPTGAFALLVRLSAGKSGLG